MCSVVVLRRLREEGWERHPRSNGMLLTAAPARAVLINCFDGNKDQMATED